MSVYVHVSYHLLPPVQHISHHKMLKKTKSNRISLRERERGGGREREKGRGREGGREREREREREGEGYLLLLQVLSQYCLSHF